MTSDFFFLTKILTSVWELQHKTFSKLKDLHSGGFKI